METVKQQIEAEMKMWEAQHKHDLDAGNIHDALRMANYVQALGWCLRIVESAIEREREAAAERAF